MNLDRMEHLASVRQALGLDDDEWRELLKAHGGVERQEELTPGPAYAAVCFELAARCSERAALADAAEAKDKGQLH